MFSILHYGYTLNIMQASINFKTIFLTRKCEKINNLYFQKVYLQGFVVGGVEKRSSEKISAGSSKINKKYNIVFYSKMLYTECLKFTHSK